MAGINGWLVCTLVGGVVGWRVGGAEGGGIGGGLVSRCGVARRWIYWWGTGWCDGWRNTWATVVCNYSVVLVVIIGKDVKWVVIACMPLMD
jgi:hypothetical protein